VNVLDGSQIKKKQSFMYSIPNAGRWEREQNFFILPFTLVVPKRRQVF